jgi:hypothetical protein
MDQQMNQTGMVCKCSHHKFVPGLVISFGLLFLLQALGVVGSGLVDLLWPILVILAGFMKMSQVKCKCC